MFISINLKSFNILYLKALYNNFST